MLKDVQQPATFFIPGVTAERYPLMVEQVLDAGHEIAHHSHTHRTAVSMSFDDERGDFDLALSALGRFGISPTGHRAAMWEPSWQTPSLVAEYGLKYDSSLMDSDVPYLIRNPCGDSCGASPALESGRLGAVCLPSGTQDRGNHPVATGRGGYVDSRDRRNATTWRPFHAHLPPVPHWAGGTAGGPEDRHRNSHGTRRRPLLYVRSARRSGTRRPCLGCRTPHTGDSVRGAVSGLLNRSFSPTARSFTPTERLSERRLRAMNYPSQLLPDAPVQHMFQYLLTLIGKSKLHEHGRGPPGGNCTDAHS